MAEDTEDTGPGIGYGGLSSMRLAGADQLDQLANQPIVDPSTKWLKFAAGALDPSAGGKFGNAMGNAVGALAGQQNVEAELRAKYLPIVAQALLMRQQQAISIQQHQQKLLGDWDAALTGQLTGLLRKPSFTTEDVQRTIGGVVRLGQVHPAFALQYWQNMPKDSPEEMRAYIMSKAIGGMGSNERVGAVSPKVELKNPNEGFTPANINPNAPQPVGPMKGGIPPTLTPKDRLPVGVDTPQGPMVRDPVEGTAAFVGSPGAQALSQGATRGLLPEPLVGAPGGAPGQPTPQVPMPVTPPPSVSAQQNLARNEADKGAGTSFSKYEDALNAEVSTMSDLVFRTKQLQEYAKAFRTGATGDIRSKGAAFAKDVALSLGASQQYADKLGNGIAGGDVASAQAFHKLAVQSAMQSLKAAAGPGQRFTQAEFQKFQDANLNLDMDPRAMETISNFVMDQARKVSAEQEFVAKARAANMPIPQIRVEWEREKAKINENQPVKIGNVLKGTIGPSSRTRIGTDVDGRKMKLNAAGQWEYE